MASQDAPTIEDAHCLTLELIEILEGAENAAKRYEVQTKSEHRYRRGAQFADRMFWLRDTYKRLARALKDLEQPFVTPTTAVVQVGQFFAESAHNLVCTIALSLWGNIEFDVADEYQPLGDEIAALPAPPENVAAKVDLAIASFRDFPMPSQEDFNRLRTECEREYVIASRTAPKPSAYTGGQDNWWHGPHEARPAEYRHGPLMGQKKQISQWLGEKPTRTPRRLEQKARTGVLWVIRHGETSWEAWFKDERLWEQARLKRDFP